SIRIVARADAAGQATPLTRSEWGVFKPARQLSIGFPFHSPADLFFVARFEVARFEVARFEVARFEVARFDKIGQQLQSAAHPSSISGSAEVKEQASGGGKEQGRFCGAGL